MFKCFSKKKKEPNVEWVYMYEVVADDDKGPWQLISKHNPVSNGFLELKKQHAERLKYKGAFPLEHLSRQVKNSNITNEIKVEEEKI